MRLGNLLLAASSLFHRPLSTVQIVGDVYLDVLAKVDHLPEWDGDTSITSPIETLPGGSALNTAVHLSALLRTRKQRDQLRPIRRCVLHSRVGADLYGRLVSDRIRQSGVTLSARREGGQGVCICLSGQEDRAFVSYKGSVSALTEADIDPALLFEHGTSHVHFSAYYDCVGLQPAVPKLIRRAREERNATISLVPQADASETWGSGLLELLPSVDVLLCNQREATAIAGVEYAGRRPNWGELDEAVRRLLDRGVPLVVVTLGAEGAIAANQRQEWWFQPTVPQSPVDTTGCGDAFAAGFLFGWCGSRDVRRGLVYGCACGSAAVGTMGGATPLDSATVDQFLPKVAADGAWGTAADFGFESIGPEHASHSGDVAGEATGEASAEVGAAAADELAGEPDHEVFGEVRRDDGWRERVRRAVRRVREGREEARRR